MELLEHSRFILQLTFTFSFPSNSQVIFDLTRALELKMKCPYSFKLIILYGYLVPETEYLHFQAFLFNTLHIMFLYYLGYSCYEWSCSILSL